MKFRIRTLLVITALCAVLIFAINFAVTRLPGYKLRLESFQNQLVELMTPDKLQQWAIASIEAVDKNSTIEDSKLLTLPKFGSPTHIEVVRKGTNEYLYAHWGDGFGHWGIMVGNEQLLFPGGDEYDYIEWAPGVYVWHELQ